MATFRCVRSERSSGRLHPRGWTPGLGGDPGRSGLRFSGARRTGGPRDGQDPMTTGDAPPVTVVIPTRNRGDSVVMTLQTLLTSNYRAFEVRVVDQSESDSTEIAVKRLLGDARIHYTRSATRGLSAALNCGIGSAASEFIAITGDDCAVGVDWLGTLTAAFA